MNKKHVLLIDDEPEIRDMLSQLLTLKGHRVSQAGGADEARHVVRQDPPDLIISDLQMEDTDGLVLIDEFKQSLPKVPVMLLTGVMFDAEVVNETINKKVACYLDKTTPLQRVAAEVNRLLSGTPPQSA